MTTTSFFCRKKALWPFPPITLPRPEPFVNPAPQILQLLCREAKAAADDVTDDANKDGLYNAFVHLGLI